MRDPQAKLDTPDSQRSPSKPGPKLFNFPCQHVVAIAADAEILKPFERREKIHEDIRDG